MDVIWMRYGCNMDVMWMYLIWIKYGMQWEKGIQWDIATKHSSSPSNAQVWCASMYLRCVWTNSKRQPVEVSTSHGGSRILSKWMVYFMENPKKKWMLQGYLVAHPTARKWVITSVISGLTLQKSHVNHWGNPLTSRGMSHQVPLFQETSTRVLAEMESQRVACSDPLYRTEAAKMVNHLRFIASLWLWLT